MTKTIPMFLAGCAALALATGVSLAQTAPTTPGAPAAQGDQRPGFGHKHHGPSPEVMGRMFEGRLAGTKAALKLSADQEKLWPAVEQALRDNRAEMRKSMADRRQAMGPAQGAQGAQGTPGEHPKFDLLAGLQLRADMAALRAKETARLIDAVKPLYQTLDENQKVVLATLLAQHRGGHEGGQGGRWHRHG